MTADLCIWSDLFYCVDEEEKVKKNYANPRIRSEDERDGATINMSAH